MTYEQIKHPKPEDFKRLCGVHPETFTKMVAVVRSLAHQKKKAGRLTKLSLEDQIVLIPFSTGFARYECKLSKGFRIPNSASL